MQHACVVREVKGELTAGLGLRVRTASIQFIARGISALCYKQKAKMYTSL